VGRDLGLGELADHLAQLHLFGRELEVHRLIIDGFPRQCVPPARPIKRAPSGTFL
jgi:hypothetical protein